MLTDHQEPLEGAAETVSSTDGVRLAVHELGRRPADSSSRASTPGSAESSPALCLIAHATGFHGRCYRVLADELREADTISRIVAPDLRAHGDSTAPEDGDFSWDGFANDVLAVLEHLGYPRTRAIGHSMGGAALLRAEQLRHGTFERLFLYEPIVFPPQLGRSGNDSPLVGAAERRRSQFPSAEDAVARFASKPPLDALDPRCLRDYVHFGFRPVDPNRPDAGIELKLPGPEEADVYRMSTTHATWDELGDVSVPVSIACGTARPGAPAEVVPSLVERLPNAQLVEFDHLGHFGPLEDPLALSQAIRASWKTS